MEQDLVSRDPRSQVKFVRHLSRRGDECRIEVQCVCGKVFDTNKYRFIRGKIKSCGCLKAKFQFEWATANSVKKLWKRLYARYVYGAKQRGHRFELTEQEFYVLSLQPCHYCGSLLTQQFFNRDKTHSVKYTGIDRKNNYNGYTLKNCVTCCTTCNFGKHNLTYEEFITHCNNLARHRGNL